MVIRGTPNRICVQISIVISTDIVIIIGSTTTPSGRYSFYMTYRFSFSKILLNQDIEVWRSCFFIEYTYRFVSGSSCWESSGRYIGSSIACIWCNSRQGSRIRGIVAITCLIGSHIYPCNSITVIYCSSGKCRRSKRLFYIHYLTPSTRGSSSRNTCIAYLYSMVSWGNVCKVVPCRSTSRYPCTSIYTVFIGSTSTTRYIGNTYCSRVGRSSTSQLDYSCKGFDRSVTSRYIHNYVLEICS